tara:strand:- start:251 stop:442 length:192 start_codon:yes stop_codon:yes gene_type:complete
MRNLPDDLSRLENDLATLLMRFGISVESIDVSHSRIVHGSFRDTSITISATTEIKLASKIEVK